MWYEWHYWVSDFQVCKMEKLSAFQRDIVRLQSRIVGMGWGGAGGGSRACSKWFRISLFLSPSSLPFAAVWTRASHLTSSLVSFTGIWDYNCAYFTESFNVRQSCPSHNTHAQCKSFPLVMSAKQIFSELHKRCQQAPHPALAEPLPHYNASSLLISWLALSSLLTWWPLPPW